MMHIAGSGPVLIQLDRLLQDVDQVLCSGVSNQAILGSIAPESWELCGLSQLAVAHKSAIDTPSPENLFLLRHHILWLRRALWEGDAPPEEGKQLSGFLERETYFLVVAPIRVGGRLLTAGLLGGGRPSTRAKAKIEINTDFQVASPLIADDCSVHPTDPLLTGAWTVTAAAWQENLADSAGPIPIWTIQTGTQTAFSLPYIIQGALELAPAEWSDLKLLPGLTIFRAGPLTTRWGINMRFFEPPHEANLGMVIRRSKDLAVLCWGTGDLITPVLLLGEGGLPNLPLAAGPLSETDFDPPSPRGRLARFTTSILGGIQY